MFCHPVGRTSITQAVGSGLCCVLSGQQSLTVTRSGACWHHHAVRCRVSSLTAPTLPGRCICTHACIKGSTVSACTACETLDLARQSRFDGYKSVGALVETAQACGRTSWQTAVLWRCRCSAAALDHHHQMQWHIRTFKRLCPVARGHLTPCAPACRHLPQAHCPRWPPAPSGDQTLRDIWCGSGIRPCTTHCTASVGSAAYRPHR